ncbi:rRNA maturation RNase YbeY [Marinibacterium profundimaris]|uniref:Endoribonuclease YbeY n=1 Tax=Marinibacterium profundimaris TaxID=1679460 RepID=A0A225NL84_9RHOB|nr:rRNA maturation RNase YbeY [Marinibacterium profundimaris]OWU70542.1 rRNA maturation factor [Marinibacterium profundimaris]
MPVETITEDSRWEALDLEALADRAADAALTRLGLAPEAAEISLLACDDARIAVLNAEFRGKPAPTNVLSWPAEDLSPDTPGGDPLTPEPDPGGDLTLGDIAIAWDTCAREASAAGKPMADHVTHLVVHGVLHLLGYDHVDDADAARMEALEVEILSGLGLENPYIVANGS